MKYNQSLFELIRKNNPKYYDDFRKSIVFPLESFTIKEICDYVIEHCVVNWNQYRFFRSGSANSPLYSNPATYSANNDYELGLYRGMASQPLDRKEHGWYITYAGDFLIQRFNLDLRINKIGDAYGWDLSRPHQNGGKFYVAYFDGKNYYARKFNMFSKHQDLSHPYYNVKIDSLDFLELNEDGFRGKYFPLTKKEDGWNLRKWQRGSFITEMVHFKLDPNLFYSNQLLDFINWPLEKPQGLIR